MQGYCSIWNEGHSIGAALKKRLATERQKVIICAETTQLRISKQVNYCLLVLQIEKMFPPVLLGELSQAERCFCTIGVFSLNGLENNAWEYAGCSGEGQY